MKITKEHYEYMKSKMAEKAYMIPAIKDQIRMEPTPPSNFDRRVRWDMLWCAGIMGWVTGTLYGYLNDQNVDTALKHIMKEIQ